LTLQVTVNGKSQDFTTDRITPFRLQAEAFAAQVLKGEHTADRGEAILEAGSDIGCVVCLRLGKGSKKTE